MNIILSLLSLIFGFILGIFINSNIWLPVLYGLPRTTFLFIKGEIKFKAIIVCLVTPALWVVTILGFLFFSAGFFPSVNHYFTNNSAFVVGWTFSLAQIPWIFIMPGLRKTMVQEFEASIVSKYRKS